MEETGKRRSRKRQRDPSSWKRSREKQERYSAKSLPVYPTCNHRGKKNTCRLLKMKDIKNFHNSFYSCHTKSAQDAFILKYCCSSLPARRRSRNNARSEKGITIQYNIVNQVGIRHSVCRETFLSALGITKHRVQGVFKRFKRDGVPIPVETRGGDRRSKAYERNSTSVVNFISKFKAIESHYCRANSERVYLDCNLNIKKMWRMYNQEVPADLKVKDSYFRHIFNTHFNISFKSPSTDVCSKCLELSEKLKRETDTNERNRIMTEKRVHKLRYKQFYDMLRQEKPGLLTISFDCQKNLVLPKVCDQSAYYSRQLYCYNFTTVKGSSSSKMPKENTSIYTWCEADRPKASNEIVSAVYHELQTSDLLGIDTIRLVADGCAGQNKNIAMLTMCCKWLLDSPPDIKSVEIIFPVVGHSFLPPDRVFGRIEKELKKTETILNPSEYHSIFQRHGSVKILGESWNVYDWKGEALSVMKPTSALHFKISHCKRFYLRRSKRSDNILVRGEEFYRTDIGLDKSITRKQKSLSVVNPKQLSVGIPIKQEKKKDVDNLLSKHFGAEWMKMDDLHWYRNVFERDHINENVNEETFCEIHHHDAPII